MHELATSETIQNTITIINASLDVMLDVHQSFGNWQLIVMGLESPPLDSKFQRLDLSEAESSGKKELKKIG